MLLIVFRFGWLFFLNRVWLFDGFRFFCISVFLFTLKITDQAKGNSKEDKDKKGPGKIILKRREAEKESERIPERYVGTQKRNQDHDQIVDDDSDRNPKQEPRSAAKSAASE